MLKTDRTSGLVDKVHKLWTSMKVYWPKVESSTTFRQSWGRLYFFYDGWKCLIGLFKNVSLIATFYTSKRLKYIRTFVRSWYKMDDIYRVILVGKRYEKARFKLRNRYRCTCVLFSARFNRNPHVSCATSRIWSGHGLGTHSPRMGRYSFLGEYDFFGIDRSAFHIALELDYVYG